MGTNSEVPKSGREGIRDILRRLTTLERRPNNLPDISAFKNPDTLAVRTATGTLQAATPVAANDLATKAYVDGLKRIAALGTAIASASLTLTNTFTDITGCTTGALALKAGDVVMLDGVFDVNLPGSTFQGRLNINGTALPSPEAHLLPPTSRATVTQIWSYTVPSDGNYTFKLQGAVTSTTGGVVQTNHTVIRWVVYR